MLGTPSRHASLRVAQHPAQQPKVIWAVHCLHPLESGNCALVSIFFNVSGDTWMPAFLSPNECGNYPSYKTAWSKAQFPPDTYFSFKVQSQVLCSWQSETSKFMPYTPPKHFPTWRQQSRALIPKHETWQACNLNHSFDFVSSPGSDYRRASQNWLGETLRADTWKAI